MALVTLIYVNALPNQRAGEEPAVAMQRLPTKGEGNAQPCSPAIKTNLIQQAIFAFPASVRTARERLPSSLPDRGLAFAHFSSDFLSTNTRITYFFAYYQISLKFLVDLVG